VAQARAVAVALAVRGGTRRALERRMPIVSRLAIAAVLTALGARTASAQVAGVIAPPPAPPPQAPPAVAAAATPSTSAAARRDSLALAQRLDIQAWVDSAAGALARGEPASTVPLAPPTTAPSPAPSPAPDSTQRPTPRSRRPTPPRRPLGTARPDDALVLQGRDTHVTAR
jgi:hypothetical protein